MRRQNSFVLLALTCSLAGGCKRAQKGENALPSPSGALELPAVAPNDSAEEAALVSTTEDGEYRATGTVRAREKAELGPKNSGVIAAITVDEGDRVKKGQLLFRMEAHQAGLAIEQARAALESAKVALSSAELDFKRTKELFDHGSVAPATYDQAKTRYDSAKSGVEQAKVAVSQAKTAAGDTAVYAPFSGVVTHKYKNVGEIATMVPPTVVLVVQDVDVLELRSRLPERALRDLAPGETIDVSFPAIGEKRTARISRINPTVDVMTRTVEVVAEIDNTDGRLKPGMLAQVTFGAPAAKTPTAKTPAATVDPAPSASGASTR